MCSAQKPNGEAIKGDVSKGAEEKFQEHLRERFFVNGEEPSP